MKTKLLKILNWIVWNCQRFGRWVAKLWKRKAVEPKYQQLKPIVYGIPFGLKSTNKETLKDVELFNANHNLFKPTDIFKDIYDNLTYSQILSTISNGVMNIGIVKILLSGSLPLAERNFNEIYLAITNCNLNGSQTTIKVPALLNDNQYQQFQITIPYQFRLNGLTSLIINKLPPDTLFFFYPIIEQ